MPVVAVGYHRMGIFLEGVFCKDIVHCWEADAGFLWVTCKLAISRAVLARWPPLNDLCLNMAKCKIINRRINIGPCEEGLEV